MHKQRIEKIKDIVLPQCKFPDHGLTEEERQLDQPSRMAIRWGNRTNQRISEDLLNMFTHVQIAGEHKINEFCKGLLRRDGRGAYNRRFRKATDKERLAEMEGLRETGVHFDGMSLIAYRKTRKQINGGVAKLCRGMVNICSLGSDVAKEMAITEDTMLSIVGSVDAQTRDVFEVYLKHLRVELRSINMAESPDALKPADVQRRLRRYSKLAAARIEGLTKNVVDAWKRARYGHIKL